MAVVSKSILLEAGVHFGHQTKRWNPKMKPYIFGSRDDIYIIDLDKTVEGMETAYEVMKSIAENGGTFLYVGTKKQAGEVCKEEATRSNSYYVTERWLGGTLTNFRTIRRRVNRLEEIEKMEADGVFNVLPKKEVIKLKKEYEKLNRLLEGIRGMKKLPQAMIIVDSKKEENAIREAKKLNIPVFGLIDTNCDPDDVDYVIPVNDDAVRSIKVVLGALTNAICEVNNLELVDYTTEEDKAQEKVSKKEAKKEVAKEEKKETKIEKVEKIEEVEEKEEPKQEEKPAKKEETDYSKMTLTELKAVAKEKSIKGYSTMKKDELIEVLSK